MKRTELKPISRSALTLAWKKYLESGEVNCNVIKPSIAASWQRSQDAHVNPFGGQCGHVLESRELDQAQEKNADLLVMAAPLMEYYFQIIKGTGAIFLLIDPNGYILNTVGDPLVLSDAKKIHLMPGANWTEQAVGTNAIGTTLAIQKPINVNAVEHYSKFLHNWTCAAAPIFDAEDTLIGAIDISGPSKMFHAQALGIATAIANSITMKIRLHKMEEDLQLSDHRLAKVFRHASDGIIEVDANGIITNANPAFCRFLHRSAAELVGTSLTELIPHDAETLKNILQHPIGLNYECTLPSQWGQRKFLYKGESVCNTKGGVIGRQILFTPLEKSSTSVNRAKTAVQKNSIHTFSDVIGNHSALLEAKHMALLASANLSKVLLQGECGTGKEIFAQAIHNQGPRRTGPFVAMNCGAIPKELIGSELFGYEEGAFTGARRGGKAGKFEMAHGGTLFLDEIGDMPLEQQVVLLRVLQEQNVTRLGGHQETPVDVRIICASNKDLYSEVKRGSFRGDLYYRLNVITIQIPPLRERKEDIVLLFTHFLRSYESKQGQSFLIEPDVFEYLQNYPWPGNVRELQNVVERIASLTQDHTVRVNSLPREIRIPDEPWLQDAESSARQVNHFADRQSRKEEQANAAKQEITYMLDKCHGNVSHAARKLGISRNTLYRKMRMYEIVN